MAAALTKLNNKVDGVLSANDGLAGGIVIALKAQGLAGKVPVTGQDATVAGLQQILLGNQSMTIYKPLRKLADAAAKMTTRSCSAARSSPPGDRGERRRQCPEHAAAGGDGDQGQYQEHGDCRRLRDQGCSLQRHPRLGLRRHSNPRSAPARGGGCRD